MALTTVRLHGPLAQEFGKVWTLDIGSPAEAVRAIAANRPEFLKRIMDLDAKGLVFRVRAWRGKTAEDLGEEDLAHPLGSCRRVDIIPIVMGAGAGVRFVIGAALFIVGFMYGSALAMSYGMSLMAGSIAEWLTPTPPKQQQQAALNSYAFNGPVNMVDQGLPVPVIYGEVMAGSNVISAGITTENLVGGGTLGLSLAGQVTGTCSVSSGTCMNTFTLVASPSGVVLPLSYTWSTSSVAGSWLFQASDTSDQFQCSASGSAGATNTCVVTCSLTDANGQTTSASVTLTSSHTQYVESYPIWSLN